MFVKILYGLVVLIGILLVVIAMRPDAFRYERTVKINAPASVVYAHIIDFRKWEPWSPWEKMDPKVQRVYGGAPTGVGSTYHWKGDRNVGEGEMQITEATPELIRIRLEFISPMPAVNTTDFILKQEGATTTLTQAMYGKNTFMGKAFGLVMNMDTMIGTQFEKGLADIKVLSETSK